jgi:hypothetical protein
MFLNKRNILTIGKIFLKALTFFFFNLKIPAILVFNLKYNKTIENNL